MNSDIDIIVPWVDNSDPDWQNEKRKYEDTSIDKNANSEIRYQNWDNLCYWFRAVEKFMPWAHRIFLVTYGHLPDFLNVEHPKLCIVKHEEYIPKEYLPTFNSNTIEMNYHRIKNLSENFVLFNDDMIPLQPIKESYYFKNNIPCEQAIESPIMPVDIGSLSSWAITVKANDVMFINRHFKKREVYKKNFWKWINPCYGERIKRNIGLGYWYNFAGFHDPHMPVALKKNTLRKLWEIEPETLDRASRNKFRGAEDVSQYLIRYWQLCEGNFHPRKTLGKTYLITKENYKQVADDVRNQKYQMVSLNEGCSGNDFETVKNEINNAFETILPQKSSYEK
ncbi:MAG: stealth conserved region 3 domain-containing protein [Butyrivibrio sp.]